MWISYFKCKSCGSVRQCGISTGKVPSGAGKHTQHEFISSEMLILKAGQGLEETVISRCAELRFREQEAKING